jgi:hypothetical protein
MAGAAMVAAATVAVAAINDIARRKLSLFRKAF